MTMTKQQKIKLKRSTLSRLQKRNRELRVALFNLTQKCDSMRLIADEVAEAKKVL